MTELIRTSISVRLTKGQQQSSLNMTAREYKAIRESIGTPTQVAALLGVSRMTIHNRESGKPITGEAALAILSLSASAPK